MPPGADVAYMAKALALAERGRGRTSPNPMVGALVVDADGAIVGRGAHQVAGGPHAEVYALNDAGARAMGATLYCTLEPCSHTGRTGPCAPRVVEAGIRRAVIAIEDANPLVAGRGIDHLRAHGVQVDVGVLREEAERLNRAFVTRMTRRRPLVILKAAVSLDGYVASAPGARTPLTGQAANRLIHRDRAEIDAIAVGSETLLVDDPVLTARVAYRARPLVRVVFDRRLRTPPAARLFSTLQAGPVIIVTTGARAAAAPERVEALSAAGAAVAAISDQETATSGFLGAALARLAQADVTSLIVEGGPTLQRAFWSSGLVDRLMLFIAPTHLGGGVEWSVGGIGTTAALVERRAAQLGDDVLIEGYVHRTD